MLLEFKKTYSTTEPQEIDQTSPTVVFINKNIHLVKKEDPEGKEYEEYEYDSAVLTKDQYEVYAVEQVAAEENTNMEIAVAELAEQMEDVQNSIELAIAELAESILQ